MVSNTIKIDGSSIDQIKARKVVTEDMMKWAGNTFLYYRVLGSDDIYSSYMYILIWLNNQVVN